MNRRFAASISAVLLASLSLTACGDDEPATAPPPGQNDQVKAGVIAIVDVAPIYLGKQQGIFAKHQIDLTLETAQGGSAIVPNVVSGQWQFGFSNVVSLLLAQSRNVPIKVVANGNNATGDPKKDFGGIVVKDPAITSPKMLEGKKVATNALKNIVDTTVKELVKKDGGDPAKVNFVELAFPDMAAQLDAGNVDAIFVVEPFQQAALAAGARKIASSYVDVAPDLTIAMYFTSQQLLAKDPDLVKRFTEAMKESLAYADAHPDEVRAALGTYTKIPPETRDALILPRWPAEVNATSVETLAGLAQTDGLLTEKPDLAALLP
jgi:NitT/TauT family transport system substrate-binding protein